MLPDPNDENTQTLDKNYQKIILKTTLYKYTKRVKKCGVF